MIRLLDLGAEFWRNYFATGSGILAYDLTLERIQWYWRDSRRLVICCDHPVNKRREVAADYKANRKPKPADAIDALVSVEERCAAWGCPLVKCEGYEADDVIATLAGQAYPEEVQIIGTEKDLYALISENVTLHGKAGAIGFAECVEKWGVPPEQMTDFLALCGDACDNIKGCEHCGPGRAAKLLERYGSTGAIKAAAAAGTIDIKGIGEKTREALCAWDPTTALALVKLRTDAPCDLSLLIADPEDDGRAVSGWG